MDLYGMMAREFSAAKLLWTVIVLLQVVLLSCSLAASSASGTRLLVLGGAVLVIPIASTLLRWRAQTYQDRGERLRRDYVWQDALGKAPDPAMSLATAAKATHLPKLDPDSVGQYFASQAPPGLRRLAENLAESAFYTWRISALTSYFCAALAVGGMLTAVLTLWWAIQVGVPAAKPQPALHEAALRVARLFADLFGFLAAGIFAELWWSYRSLSKEADCAFQESVRIKKDEALDATSLFGIVSNYDTALAKTPPLPGSIKWLCAKQLAKLWEDHLKST